MGIQGNIAVFFYTLKNYWSKGYVGHKVPVHYIKVQKVCTALDNLPLSARRACKSPQTVLRVPKASIGFLLNSYDNRLSLYHG
jgi:hypothetical protein